MTLQSMIQFSFKDNSNYDYLNIMNRKGQQTKNVLMNFKNRKLLYHKSALIFITLISLISKKKKNTFCPNSETPGREI